MQLSPPLLIPRIGSEKSNLRILAGIKIGLASIFQLATAETTTIVARRAEEFPWGWGGGSLIILLLANLPVLRIALLRVFQL